MTVILNTRISTHLKENLNAIAKEQNITVSELARNIIKDYIENHNSRFSKNNTPNISTIDEDYYVDDDDDFVDPHSLQKIIVTCDATPVNTHNPLTTYKDLLCLLIAVTDKLIFPSSKIGKNYFQTEKYCIERLLELDNISLPLKKELLKVLNDYNRALFVSNDESVEFQFTKPNHQNSLDYSILLKELIKINQ